MIYSRRSINDLTILKPIERGYFALFSNGKEHPPHLAPFPIPCSLGWGRCSGIFAEEGTGRTGIP